jgi:hypothetical protein
MVGFVPSRNSSMITSFRRCTAQPLRRLALLSVLAIAAGAMLRPAAAQEATIDYAAIVAAPDRSDADRQTDVRREPAKMLAFTGVKPGMKSSRTSSTSAPRSPS